MPFFSVILPNYNHQQYLEERIWSVLNQSYKNFELIILDDNSTDDSKKNIEKFREQAAVTHIVYNDTNSGSPFLQWKKGMELAKGEWIWMAESDDMALPSFLEEATTIIQNNPAVGLYYTDSSVIDENGNTIEKVSAIKNSFFDTEKWSASYFNNGIDELNECLKFLCTINNASATVFKKEIFTAVQDEVTGYRYYGDWFFYIRAMLSTSVYYNNKALSSYRNHPANFISKNAPVVATKKEYYKLLIFLLSRKEITQQKELIRFFCLHYLGSGWKEEGIGKALSLFWHYFKMDSRLAVKVIPRLMGNKISRRKNTKQYP